ncbi:MAG: hypothetical protein O7B79_06855 [SAR324 cluster bacterium]|nr:hypothetical protein [SAR324 cluster bacterium]
MLTLAALLLQGCGTPSQSADCDILLGEQRYTRVLEICSNPFHRASAYLGLAGLDLFNLLSTTSTPGNVVGLLGATTANITAKRQLLVLAVEEVRTPASGSQAFALLISSFLGLGITISEFLDNGAGATALDDVIIDSEVEAASGLSFTGSSISLAIAGTPYYQTQVFGSSYTLICADVTPPICDNNPGASVSVYDDLDGSGLLDTGSLPGVSAAEAAVSAQLGISASSSGLVAMITSLDFPIAEDPAKSGQLENFLGQGDPAQQFAIGVVGFLDLLTAADAFLNASAGGTGGGVQGISDDIDAIRVRIDNGATCIATAQPAAASLLDLWLAIYLTAPGTVAQPLPNQTQFSNFNFVSNTQVPAGGVFPVSIDPTSYVFPDPLGFKFLYPISLPAAGFDVTNATPHVAQADPQFRTDFEFIPRIAPGAATVDDGTITLAEVLCVSSS